MNASRVSSTSRTARRAIAAVVFLALPAATYSLGPGGDIPRRPDGRPDLTGTYDIATLTPVERPPEYGDKLTLSDDEAAAIGSREMQLRAAQNRPSDPDREAPPEGGDGSAGAAGNVGGYDFFWIDRGEGAFKIDGLWRTSIIVDPPNGRYPALSEAGRLRAERAAPFVRANDNDGTAFWIDMEVGPYDDPELRPLQERCVLSRSRSGPPALPALYNNLKRIVQTDDHVMILAEQIHDARIIRLDAEHGPPSMRRWMGDSVGRWEGDTLVVDTVGFKTAPTGLDISEDLHVVERFTRVDRETLLYQFTVHDPRYVAPWSGELVWPATDEKLFEYACHEGNYSFGNILRGARVLERDAWAKRGEKARHSGVDGGTIRRTRAGKPDLTGVYDISSLTPFERPASYGDRVSLTEEEAIAIEKAQGEAVATRARASDPEREPPAKGGNVGAYNDFWFEWGTRGFAIDGKYRTSILIDPPNGRMPAMTAAAKERLAKGPRFDWGRNTGTAWWMETGERPYDDPEYNVLGVRCIYQPPATIPMRPLPYNNVKTIVQTEDHVTILVEWMHWARIIRLDSEHLPAEMRSLGGDSIGWWEGDTLVVETTNFLESPGVPKDGLRILEYFSAIDPDTLLYKFTVNDPDYEAPYTGELVWPRTEQRSYEYACHEGNYAMGNMLRGARLLEREWLEEKQAASAVSPQSR